MNIQAIEKLMAMLPEGPKKEALRLKLNRVNTNSTKRGGDGLQDTFEFKPQGHIKIEAIDDNGNVLDTLADQDNLVVAGAEEILLRAFSGDPNRTLYKNRVPKVTPTGKIHIDKTKLAGAPLFEGAQLVHAPNILWSAVDDSQFDITYGYYPVVVYVKEEVSTEFGKEAFSLSKSPLTGYVPLNAETYSAYSNMFIGIGEGKHYPVALGDTRLVYSNGFIPTLEQAKTTTEGHEIKFSQKISNFAIDFDASNKGAQIDVFINGVLRETIETYDSSLTEAKTRRFEYDELDNTLLTEVRLVHSGSDKGVATPEMTIKGIHFDALNKDMNGLIQEFKNFETDFLTPTTFNTTPMGPYTIQIPNFPVKKDSAVITYNGTTFTRVLTEDKLADTTYMIDEVRGTVRFNRALTGISATYSITGEIYDTELASTMQAGTLSYTTPKDNVVTAASIGTGNGSNKQFQLSQTAVTPNTLVVKANGSNMAIASFDPVTRIVILVSAPSNGYNVTADYTYVTNPSTVKTFMKYETAFGIKADTLKILDHKGQAMTLATTPQDMGDGKYMVDAQNPKLFNIAQKDAAGEIISKIEVVYESDERPGVPTNYTRAVIEKPKSINEYPWFELDNGAVRFVAEFPELKPAHNITIREMGLFDGPRIDDKVPGFRKYQVKAFSLVRVGETRKDVNTGIRVTWTITLMNDKGQPFQGGRN